MAQIKVGDVVQLKSGGPKMTVESIEANPAGILCTWFDGADKKSSCFQPDALEPAPKKTKKATPRRPRRRLPLDDVD
jgi:uncharacterized protein YodC (DUF2158 family)